ncbi:MAG: DUF1569 domain-containing protein [Acidobacteriia bacterium]|nr:DUF1569 domain-containing protein [Terriglobia bacterium]
MKTLLNTQDKAEIVARLQTLRPTSMRRWGKMSVLQMVCHLSDSFRGPMGEKALTPANWLARGMMKWFALWVPIPWPKGVKTRPEMDPQLGGTQPVDFESDLGELRRLLDRFTAQPRDFQFKPHPIFGEMSDPEWMRWGYLHMDHHLRQFGA